MISFAFARIVRQRTFKYAWYRNKGKYVRIGTFEIYLKMKPIKKVCKVCENLEIVVILVRFCDEKLYVFKRKNNIFPEKLSCPAMLCLPSDIICLLPQQTADICILLIT